MVIQFTVEWQHHEKNWTILQFQPLWQTRTQMAYISSHTYLPSENVWGIFVTNKLNSGKLFMKIRQMANFSERLSYRNVDEGRYDQYFIYPIYKR